MKIWLVNPFDSLPGETFRPGRYAFLAKLLADYGHQTTWWTSNFFHMTKTFRKPFEDRPNLKIIQLDTPAYQRNICFKRIKNHRIYSKKFEQIAAGHTPPDIIIASCPPLVSANSAIKIAKRLGTKCVIDIQDLWPESFEIILPPAIAKILLYPLKKYADKIYRSADAVSAVSETYINRAAFASRNCARSFVAHLGIDIKLFDKCEKTSYLPEKKAGELWAVYIGTIGSCYDVKTVVETAAMLQSSYPNIRFFIAGDGPERTVLKKAAEDKKLANCEFLGLLEYDELVGLLRQSDIGLNVFVKNAKNAFPNKIFDYMAAGLAIINSIPGELEKIIKDNAAGLQYNAGDAESLKDAILKLHEKPQKCKEMGQTARRLVEEKFDKNKQYLKYVKFLEEIAGVSKSN